MNKKLVALVVSGMITAGTISPVFADSLCETNNFPIITEENTIPKVDTKEEETKEEDTKEEDTEVENTEEENTEKGNTEEEKPKEPEEKDTEEGKQVEELPKEEETKVDEVNEMAETLKALCKHLDNNNMKVELRKNALECKEALEKLTKSIKTTSQSDNNKKMNAIKDEYTEKNNNIYDKYIKQYKQILAKLSENVSNGTVMYQEVKECYVILDNYERQMKADKDIADKELDNLFKEYETIMDKAYEGMNKATSTVSESGSKMGSSGTSTSYSSTGTENPKTGEYTTLGASIATMIAGIAGIFVSRKR